ncbi:hypothetical protein B0T17DRAFT_592120 [Bombardia bombarda]|uniref:Myb-like domain-containing protein n=1 Tax=Bombardia bombarda TaxID=252184 RepID=A0AA39WMS8_9PEZI|nr:hypothetical protein B0T17DRAFT_592120 [Bombardia bombarda]
MLLPSAFSCDASHHASHPPQLTRLQTALFSSPPASPPQVSTQTALGNIFTTCRSLQSLIATAPAPSAGATEPITPPTSSHAQLPTPPMAHTPSPMKLRLRSRKTPDATFSATGGGDHGPTTIRKRIVKRGAAPTRGINKRRRAVDDDRGRDDEDVDSEEAEMGYNNDNNNNHEAAEEVAEDDDLPRPQTPKRARIAPEVIPLGLERSDYHELHIDGVFKDETSRVEGTDVIEEADGEPWSTEEDHILVELVLEKLKLSKSDWQDCARSLGKDRSSVGRRWKSLMANGDVGIKRTSRRSRIHGTWR